MAESTSNGQETGSRRQGPVFDRAMRAVAELDPVALGETFAGAEGAAGGRLRPLDASFPAATLTVDGLFHAGHGRLLHFEYKHDDVRGLLAQLLTYRRLIMKRYPNHHVEQHVVVLGRRQVKGYDELEKHGFALDLKVWYLREMDAGSFLARRAMAPLAVLARGTRQQRASYLREALEVIGQGTDSVSNMLREVAAVMATIRLDTPTVDKAMKESGMSTESIAEFYEKSPFGQQLLERGREGSLAAVLAIVIGKKFGDRPEIDLISRRLSRLSEAAAMDAVDSAGSFEDLLAQPSAG